MTADGAPSPYLRWAKAFLPRTDPLSLGLSGAGRPSREVYPGLGPGPAETGDLRARWREALAGRLGLPPEGVYPTIGTSHANFLVYLALARGGRVVVESPGYDPLHGVAGAVGATLATYERPIESGARIDRASLERAVLPGARLLVVTDLHNPSGLRLHPDDLALLIAVAESHDAVVLVDEVYLELDPTDRPTAARAHPRVLSTNSLTKSYGLYDLRGGWVAGHPALVAAVERWDDVVCPTHPPAPIAEALAFLPHADRRLAEVRDLAARQIARVDAWVTGREDVAWRRPDAGFTGLLRLGAAGSPLDGEVVARHAWDEERVRVVPGRFFQLPHAIRISFLLEDEPLTRALEGLGRTLDACAAGPGA